jgi:hypothetical protein
VSPDLPMVAVTRQPVLLPCSPRTLMGPKAMDNQGAAKIRKADGCGAMLEFRPHQKCPHCGNLQRRLHPEAPTLDSNVVKGSALLLDADSGEIVGAQIVNDELTELADNISHALRHITWDAPVRSKGGEARLSGMVVTHRTFGFVAPAPLRRRYGCSRSAFDRELPHVSSLLGAFLQASERALSETVPEARAHTVEAVQKVLPEAWRIMGTPWTSGIINNTAALPYHRDSGNVLGSWSAMLGARRDVEGGMLHLLDYDTYLEIPNGSVTLFDGQGITHGVSPLSAAGFDSYRYTVVAYARRTMSQCCPDPALEPERAKRRATEAQLRALEKIRKDGNDRGA